VKFSFSYKIPNCSTVLVRSDFSNQQCIIIITKVLKPQLPVALNSQISCHGAVLYCTLVFVQAGERRRCFLPTRKWRAYEILNFFVHV
jgi:hypothetical protein